MNEELAAALHYAERYDWRVIPIAPGQKFPAGIDRWQERATTDPAKIRGAWTIREGWGVGVATGEGSGIFVLDVDGEKGMESLLDLEHEHGRLPDTVECITGSGGRHIYFRLPPGVEIRNDQAGRLGPGLDVRGEGGQVLAPPTVHPTTGRRYAWEVSQHPDDSIPADPPDWLVHMLTGGPSNIERYRPPRPADDDKPGSWLAARWDWHEELTKDGATYAGSRIDRGTGQPYELWVRPDKTVEEGTSATLGYGGSNVLKVFTPNWPGLVEGRTYDPFGYYVAVRLGLDPDDPADMSAAGKALFEVRQTELDQVEIRVSDVPRETEDELKELPEPIDWATFDKQDFLAEDWLAEPFLARGRSHALYARAKQGKSLFALDVVAALATGRPVLDQPASDPVHVTYLDYEMTLDDLFERLDAMGYIGTDRSHLHYYMLPTLPPLDTKEGGALLARLVERDGAELVVVDTTSRAVEGEENDADTIRNYYRHTGSRLKQAGVTQLRIDHAGKDKAKGQRGTSAKDDDVDVVWELEQGDKGQTVRLTVKRTRLGWVRDRDFARRDEPLRYATPEAESGHVVEGTGEVMTLLDSLGVPVETTVKHAAAMLRNAGHRFGQRKISDAVRSRKRGPNVRIGVTE